MKNASARGTTRNVSGSNFEAEVAQSANLLKTMVWDWGQANTLGNAYRLAGVDEPGTLVLAQGHPRCVGKPGQMTPVEANAVDFVGLSYLPPIAVAFDTKSNSGAVSFKLELLNPKKPDGRQIAWLKDFSRMGGIASYLIADPPQQVAYWLSLNDLHLLAEGHRVVYASKKGDSYTAERWALLRSGRTQMLLAEERYPGPVEKAPAMMPWDLGALFRALTGVSNPGSEQGLVVRPGDSFAALRG